MGMLARGIPAELQAEMEKTDALDLSWARNNTRLKAPDGSRPSESFFPGWELIQKNLDVPEVVILLNQDSQGPIRAESWDDLHQYSAGVGEGKELLLTLARIVNKTLYVTNVSFGDGAGIFDGIDVYAYKPDGDVVHTPV